MYRILAAIEVLGLGPQNAVDRLHNQQSREPVFDCGSSWLTAAYHVHVHALTLSAPFRIARMSV
ncbi:hypothetical protein BDV95DRAFT_569087 [Massariosphaeria phaeospora]|uniref:Uncharacterized protein n=1 Tax=Massariosphaeria phaeospora TaxID=100035 RepID=A0A7C8MAW0_9PLEO|nr:hypothetical protein BDV95DRAFT_569087 [Massariosphaeria phaeospora]